MTILLLSDIHANIEALEAVLQQATGHDTVWFLGDIVGYGPDPQACVDRLRDLQPEHWLAGNHDWAAVGRMDVAEFNPEARRAAHWTRRSLDAPARDWLWGREPLAAAGEPPALLVHGSPRHPIWEYVLDASVAMDSFAHFEQRIAFFGHTHVPTLYEERVDGALRHPVEEGTPVDLASGRWLVNPGSVGQPRDGDPRASYAVYDPVALSVTFHRVPYPVAATQDKIVKAGLPGRLAQRLSFGW